MIVPLSHSTLGSIVLSKNDTRDIHIALYAEDIIIGSGFDLYKEILDGYQWTSGDITYRFVVTLLSDRDIYRGCLTTQNFDFLLMPGGGGGGYVTLTKSYYRLPWVHFWRNQVIDFIKDGGGYFGVCGGTYSFLGLDCSPRTPFEYYFEKSALNISCVKLSFLSYANPIFCQWAGLPPEAVGHAAYLCYTGWNRSGTIYSGIPLDVPLNTSHSLFDDYVTDAVRIRWISGPAYVIPVHPDREVSVLAWYPAEEISENQSTQIHAWKYTGGFLGFLPGFLSYFRQGRTLLQGLLNVYTHAGDWVQTTTVLQTNFSKKPFMTGEVYPNEQGARLLMCAGHPEYPVWWGGCIEEANDTAHNSLYDSLYYWTHILPENQTVEDEKTYNWWMVRRGAAWTAQVPENDLPPVYGSSQVNDITPYDQPLGFNLAGNAVSTSGRITVELYYRYSLDNLTWGPWVYYTIDENDADGWGWSFDASLVNGSGYYQFYSLRKVQTMDEWVNETAPPGPDAIAYIHET
jgi:hypothetical protein